MHYKLDVSLLETGLAHQAFLDRLSPSGRRVMRRTVLSRLTTTILIALLLCAVSSPSIAQTMDIDEVQIIVAVSRSAGVLDNQPYGLRIEVVGSNIDGVSVMTPAGPVHDLICSGNECYYSSPDFNSLAAMGDPNVDPNAVGFGSFEFTFTGLDLSQDSVILEFDPGGSDPHTGYGNVIDPNAGQTEVSLNQTFSWACANGPCGNFAWFMEIFRIMGPMETLEYETDMFDPNANQWTPGPLTPDVNYGFWITAGSLLNPDPNTQFITTETTVGNDEFLYPALFETSNEIQFHTRSPSSNPGNVPPSMMVELVAPTQLRISWSQSDCEGGQSYGIYEGTIGSWYSHTAIDCDDNGADRAEIVTVPPGDVYYLVVPLGTADEGSYGVDSSSIERPPSTLTTCQPAQILGCF